MRGGFETSKFSKALCRTPLYAVVGFPFNGRESAYDLGNAVLFALTTTEHKDALSRIGSHMMTIEQRLPTGT